MPSLLLVFCVGGVSAEERVHVLQSGETLYTLARLYGVDVERIEAYNDIADPTRLPVGARILIPGTYTVSEGEYVYSIARQLGIDWKELLSANGLAESDIVRPGDVLVVPYVFAEAGATATPDPLSGDAEADVIVSTGETGDPHVTGDPRSSSDATASVSFRWPHPGERELAVGKFPGMVMRGAAGDPFVSVARGVVTFISPYSGYAKMILVQGGDGYLYGYAGAETVSVEQGDRVENGTVLGMIGFSSVLQSTSLLFTVWKNNRYVDPETAPRG